MKNRKITLCLAALLLPFGLFAQIIDSVSTLAPYKGNILPLKNIKVSPEGCAAPDGAVEKLIDGSTLKAENCFHTPLTGMPKQDVIIEADIDGKGKRLDEVVLDHRASGSVEGAILSAEVWVFADGMYQQVGNFRLNSILKRINVPLSRPIDNPEKVKVIVKNAFAEAKKYSVCVGELACVSYTPEGLARSKVLEDAAKKREMALMEQQWWLQYKMILDNGLGKVKAYNGTVIPMYGLTLTPSDCAAKQNGIDKMVDGINLGDYTEFHTPWGGMPKQDIVLEASLDGKGKQMDEFVLDQREAGMGGRMRTGTLWVMSKGKYRKVMDLDATMTNTRCTYVLPKPVKDPQRVKLVVTDSYSDNGNFMVCLGEWACIMHPQKAKMK
jgi:hypothetical protein